MDRGWIYSDDHVCRIPLSLIYGGSYSASIFPLELKGKPHGEIQLSLSFEGEVCIFPLVYLLFTT